MEGVRQQWERFGRVTVLCREVEGHSIFLSPLSCPVDGGSRLQVAVSNAFETVCARAEPQVLGENR